MTVPSCSKFVACTVLSLVSCLSSSEEGKPRAVAPNSEETGGLDRGNTGLPAPGTRDSTSIDAPSTSRGADFTMPPDAGPATTSSETGETSVVAEDSNSAPAETESLCNFDNNWSEPEVIPQFADLQFDEVISINLHGDIWLGWESGYGAGSPRAILAHRNGDRQPFEVAPGYDLQLGAGLSPDGLTLTLVEEGGASLATVHRPTLQQPFGSPDLETFSAVYLAGRQSGLTYQFPVFADGLAVLTGFDRAGRSFVVELGFDGERWAINQPASADYRTGTAEAPRLATGISTDALSLLYWEPFQQSGFATTRPNVRLAYQSPVALPSGRAMRPNADCSKLYFLDGEGRACRRTRTPLKKLP